MVGPLDMSDFHFAWPMAFWLLALIPIGWWLYLRRRREQLRRQAMRFSYTALVAQLNMQPAAWKRLSAPLLTSLLAVFLILGLARPTMVAQVPVNTVDMMLVLDISLSMMADDIKPDRITAAKDAAVHFVDSLPRDARIGLEVFAGDNYVLSPPTSRHGEITAYLRALRKEDLKPRTEIGSALHTALKILDSSTDKAPAAASQDKSQQAAKPTGDRAPERVIVLMSDGDSHEGYPWDQAARDARQDHVVIHAVGVGSVEGTSITFQGMELPVLFSEQTLRDIAGITGGSYFRVFKEADFRRVYDQIRERTVHYEEQTVELAYLASGLAFLTLIGLLALVIFL